MTSVVIADDQPAIVASLAAILDSEPDLDVIASVSDGRAAVEAVSTHHPDVVLLDVRMPGGDGLTALADMVRRNLVGRGRTGVLILTTFDLDEYVEAALRGGANGFLVKTVSFEQLVSAVRAIAAGERVLSPAATRRLVDRYLAERMGTSTPRARHRVSRLTPRETDVLRLVGRGHSNAEIAAKLFVSEHTVKTHLGAVFAKSACRDRSEAIVLAYDAGLVAAGDDG